MAGPERLILHDPAWEPSKNSFFVWKKRKKIVIDGRAHFAAQLFWEPSTDELSEQRRNMRKVRYGVVGQVHELGTDQIAIATSENVEFQIAGRHCVTAGCSLNDGGTSRTRGYVKRA